MGTRGKTDKGERKMKKIFGMLWILTAVSVFFTGCSGTPAALEKPAEDIRKEEAADSDSLKTGLFVSAAQTTENAEEDSDGSVTTDISVIAVTVDDSGVIESCIIDAVQGKITVDSKGQVTKGAEEILSKNELGDSYGMKQFSSIGKEWNEQAAAVAEYAEGKTIEELKKGATASDGTEKDADLSSSATIYLGGFISGIEEAVRDAQDLGAKKGDELVMTVVSDGSSSFSATEETEGNAAVISKITVSTLREETVTSCIEDTVQSTAFFGRDGVFREGTSGNVLSSKQQSKKEGFE